MKKFFTLVTLILSIGLIANDYYLIDVRTPEEFKSGYLEDAINIEWQNIKNLNKEIKKDDKIYLYCRSFEYIFEVFSAEKFMKEFFFSFPKVSIKSSYVN